LADADARAARDVIANYEDVSTSGFITRVVYAQGKTSTESSIGNAVIQSLVDLADMGTIARSIARQALHVGSYSLPQGVNDYLRRMGECARALTNSFEGILSTGSMDEFRCAEDEIESVRRELLADIAGIQWGHGGRTALQLMRFDAYYERFTDRATAVAQRMKLVYEDSPDDY
jgi:phosphate uptake regulator